MSGSGTSWVRFPQWDKYLFLSYLIWWQYVRWNIICSLSHIFHILRHICLLRSFGYQKSPKKIYVWSGNRTHDLTVARHNLRKTFNFHVCHRSTPCVLPQPQRAMFRQAAACGRSNLNGNTYQEALQATNHVRKSQSTLTLTGTKWRSS